MVSQNNIYQSSLKIAKVIFTGVLGYVACISEKEEVHGLHLGGGEDLAHFVE